MQNWVKTFFSSTDKLLDILNVGRMIFYTSAGLLTLYPLLMIANLMTMSSPTTYFQSLAVTANEVGSVWLVFFGALVSGFVIAQIAFHTIVRPLFTRASRENADYVAGEYSFNYRYPQLRNDPDEHDYQAWLIAEYFRYVEIATFLPLGLYLGLCGLQGFTLLYLVVYAIPAGSMAIAYPALIVSLVLFILMPVARYVVWPNYWIKQVLAPTLATYVRAKMALIKGLEDFAAEAGGAQKGTASLKQPTTQS